MIDLGYAGMDLNKKSFPNSTNTSKAQVFEIYFLLCTVKLGNKEQFDKEKIGIKEPFPVTNLPFTS